MFVVDKFSNRHFLVDTGASYSVFPHKSAAMPCGPSLSGPDGKAIPCWGPRRLRLTFGRRRFTWPFLLAAVRFPIIGMDFLKHYRLLVDPAGGQILDLAANAVATTDTSEAAAIECELQGTTCGAVLPPLSPPSPSVSPPSPTAQPSRPKNTTTVAGAEHVPAMLHARYAAVFNAAAGMPAETHGVEHHLVTAGPPIASKFRRLDGVKLAAAKAEFEKMEQEGVIRRSTSPWASPLHMVEKADGGWRLGEVDF
jgi:hypothetical protein